MNLRGTGKNAILLTALLALPAAAAPSPDPHQGKFEIAAATQGLTGTGKLLAVIETSLGTFHCELFAEDAPNTVANFVGLARGLRAFHDPKTDSWVKRPFYDGLIFHRVIPRFMIQGGDVTGSGSGSIGYDILDEKNGSHRFDRGGMMAMANRGLNTATSQFFITEVPTPALDDGGRAGGHYQIFGQCPEVDLVQKITAVPRNPMDRPNQEVKIVKVTIQREVPAADKAGAAGAAKKTPKAPPKKAAPPPG